MKKILEKELLAVIKSIKGTAKAGIDFVKQQAPDVVNQILKYEAVTKGICFALWIISLLLLVIVDIVIVIKAIPVLIVGTNEIACILYILGTAFLNLFAIAGLSSTMQSFDGLLKVIIAPKVFLIEYIQDLIERNR